MHCFAWVSLIVSLYTSILFAGFPDSFDALESTEHFVVYYRRQETSQEQAKNVLMVGEKYFEKLKSYLGENRTPKRLKIFLEGNAYNSTQKTFRYPSVDKNGDIRLYRFSGEIFPYSEAIPHEMVHAFRTLAWKEKSGHDYLTGFGFVEEGFAEFVSVMIASEYKSFVRYGYPLEAIIGFLFEDDKEIPLEVLFEHHEINPKCIAQAYPLRASFFQFLNASFGKEKVFSLAYYPLPLSQQTFKEIFGYSFGELIVQWKTFATDSYKNLNNGFQLKEDYKTKTPIMHFYFCQAGKDW